MNNNMNDQNNQVTNNNVSGTFFNNIEHPFDQGMNNNMNVQPNQGMNNNMNVQPNQGMNNGFNGNNNFNQGNIEYMQNPSYVPNNNKQNGNKKTLIYVAVGVAVLLVVTVIISLLSKSSENVLSNNDPETKRTLTCTTHHAAFGVYYDETYKYYIDDESLTVKVIEKIDLEKTQLEGNVDEWAKEKIDSGKNECDSTAGCKFEHNYSKGKYLETAVILGKEITAEQVKGMTADEIYIQQKEKHESGELGSIYTCVGNGIESTDSNN